MTGTVPHRVTARSACILPLGLSDGASTADTRVLLCVFTPPHRSFQSALFNFKSLLLVILLLICTSTYVRAQAPYLIEKNNPG